ncbi:hypothetical protein [Croceicoccus naphthovorans]|jgi:hypothetical protein|uniref:hypothetical protein n=1 Tax=Croceicoccus naphthovorans TaxID=1348774 RepID=UPI0012E09BAD|nr:hypothetical protein [Croceicoccus naphthovorans]MBB3991057.1 hypothetical protein [Croceicoccus naphthovorans]MCP5233713.1 hypothetical protein [Zoogloeaceae bacterium]
MSRTVWCVRVGRLRAKDQADERVGVNTAPHPIAVGGHSEPPSSVASGTLSRAHFMHLKRNVDEPRLDLDGRRWCYNDAM